MNLLQRFFGLFGGGGSPRSGGRYITLYLLSRRCNEPISGQVDTLNELSASDDAQYTYYARKVIHTSGEHRCFDQVEVNLYFNQNKQIVHHEVQGGRWLTAEEYDQELARFHAPPEDEPEAEPEAEPPADSPPPDQANPAKDADHA
jgi:hypothetical protein